MGRRLAAVETRADATLGRTRAVTDPLEGEIGELGHLVKQLADTLADQQATLAEHRVTLADHQVALADQQVTLADHQGTLDALQRQPAPAPAGVLAAEALAQRFAQAPAPIKLPEPLDLPEPLELQAPAELQASAEPARPAAPDPAPPAQPEPAPAASIDNSAREAALATIRTAIEANRFDLYLQPIVTLPQRKIRYYEATSRLRDHRGQLIYAADFVPQAEDGGLMPRIDNLVIFRCVQVVRRLLLKSRDVGLFCNLSGSTITDSICFPQLLEFLDANRTLAPALVLEFPQQAVRAMGPIEHESLAALTERGFRFSMDNVTDLRLEPRDLAVHGFRFVKIQANLLLNRTGTTTSNIHPADLADLVGRFGIDLIAEKVESEGSVVDLLDHDLRYGQGFLFSPPRPVRTEALQGIPEHSVGGARELAAGHADRSVPVKPRTAAAPDMARGASALAQLARSVAARG
jgi:cyclic-di-GMP phosphodiesterase TipF (flagellum assembly factor)